jgi:hypothetical protein
MDYSRWREPMKAPREIVRPAEVCKALLSALEASEGRRKRRKRDQTPDAIGLAVKRQLLERVVQDDPEAAMFEAWLFQHCTHNEGAQSPGAVAAMARVVFEEWRLAYAMDDFKAWLERGAPSDDADVGPMRPRP